MTNNKISHLLLEDYKMLAHYLEGNSIKSILACTEKNIAMLMENGIIINFSHLEDELIFDIELPVQA